MKVLSYNIYGVKNTPNGIPMWEIRQKNLEKILNEVLEDLEIKVACFQEVNDYNIDMLESILKSYNFECLKKFPMITESLEQYNIVAVKKEKGLTVNGLVCVPHGSDLEYKEPMNQIIDYGMSDYRTTVFVNIEFKNKTYLIGNTHTDYISTEGKIKGIKKSLHFMNGIDADYKMVLGDMNMVCHMSEVYQILKENNNYMTLSRSSEFNVTDNSWHGYGLKEQVNVDFAFIEKEKIECYDYHIIKQSNMMDEGSDHRPIIITVIEE